MGASGRREGRDYSYGVYIWHWPLLVLLSALGAPAWGLPGYAATGLGLTLVAAHLSWTLVEAPALARKDLLRRPNPNHPCDPPGDPASSQADGEARPVTVQDAAVGAR